MGETEAASRIGRKRTIPETAFAGNRAPRRLDVLRNGLKDSGIKFRLAYFRPSSALNEELQRLHAANLFSVARQVRYSRKNENFLFDQYLSGHRQAEELLKLQESKTLEFKSTLRWNLKEDREDRAVTHSVLKTIAAFLNTEGGDLLIGVSDDRTVLGINQDQLENDDKFMRHLMQMSRNALGDRASTWIDPITQIVQGKTICLVSCRRSPEPVYLKWKGPQENPDGDFYVRSGPGTVKLKKEDTLPYIQTRFAQHKG